MFEFALFSLPTLIYVLVQSRRAGIGTRPAAKRAGFTWGKASWWGWSLLLLTPSIALAWLTTTLLPAGIESSQGVEVATFTSAVAVANTVFRAVGEEVCFRGLLGGVLINRLGFWWGNTIQAVLFWLPHLILLLADIRLWVVLPFQFLSGWVYGWIRHKSGSFLPTGVLHAASNLLTGLFVA